MIQLRYATMNDVALLLEWRNDPDVLAVSCNQKPVSMEEHVCWLREIFNSRDREIFIAEVDGQPVGQGRIERAWKALSPRMDGCLLSYSVAKEHRGKGLGKQLVEQLVKAAHARDYATVGARIKRDNMASMLCAIKSGVNSIELF